MKSDLASSSPLSPGDIEVLQARFSKLEADVDAFSMTLTRLANAHRLSGRRGGVNYDASRHQQIRRLAFASPSSTLAMVMVVVVGAAMTLAVRKMRAQKVGHSELLVMLPGSRPGFVVFLSHELCHLSSTLTRVVQCTSALFVTFNTDVAV